MERARFRASIASATTHNSSGSNMATTSSSTFFAGGESENDGLLNSATGLPMKTSSSNALKKNEVVEAKDGKDAEGNSALSSSTGAGSSASSSAANAQVNIHFWTISAVVTIIFLCHGWIAEMLVISVVNNGYSLGWFFAFLTVIGQWLPTLPKRGWAKSTFRAEHAIVGVAHCVSMGMSNSGGMLVEYNTYSLFKSSKVVFVMMVSWATLGVQPSSQELMWGIGLMLGLLMLTGADETYKPESHRVTSPITGAALLFVGISGNALVSVGQQAALQRRVLLKNPNHKAGAAGMFQCPYTWGPQNSLPVPPGTIMPSKDDEREALLFYSNIISMSMLGVVCLMNGEMQQGIKFFTETATVSMWVAQAAAMALVAFGQRLVLTLNGTHGATAMAAVLTFRKVASFITSVMVFPKPFYPIHAMGLMIVVTSAVMIQRAEAQSSTNRKVKAENSKESSSKSPDVV